MMEIPWEALIALVLYLLGSTVGFIWWMATQTITLQFVREDLSKANEKLSSLDGTYAKAIDVAKEIARLDLSVQAAHKRIDTWTK